MTDRHPMYGLVDEVLAAELRDTAAGGSPGAGAALARTLSMYLRPWLDGAAALSTGQLAFDLCRWTRGLTPCEAAERATAHLWLTEEARRLMAMEMLAAGGREVSFYLTPGSDGRYDQPMLGFRGHASATLQRRTDSSAPRSLFVHCHPAGNLEPSPMDLSTVELLMGDEAGYAIISPDAERLYLIREPGPPRLAGHIGPPPLPAVTQTAPTEGDVDVA